MGLRQTLILQRTRLIRRLKKEERKISFPLSVPPGKKIVVFLPAELASEVSISELREQFYPVAPGAEWHFLRPEGGQLTAAESAPPVYSPNSVTVLGAVKKSIRTWLRDRVFLVIDLNTTFEPVAALLSRATQAPVRISFLKPHGHLFFNILVRTGGTSFREAAESMRKYLARLIVAAGEAVPAEP
jgi:hypothetical protein